MSTLHDRLADLADDAPPGGPVPDLWDRATRLHRVRRAGTAVIVGAVCLLLLGIAGVSWLRAAPDVQPAVGPGALPNRIWTPSPWLPGTDEAGELGALAAVHRGGRGTLTGAAPALVGISADAGEYRFLDLPDIHLTDGFALSPDGRRVAYWYTGETRRSPSSANGPVAGIAVYDSVTGQTTRKPLPTDHGVAPEELQWADPDRVVYGHRQWVGGDTDDEMDRSTADRWTGLRVWTVSSGDDVSLGLGPSATAVSGSTGRGQLLVYDDSRWTFVDVDAPDERRVFDVPMSGYARTVAVDDAGSRVAWVYGAQDPARIAVGPVIDGERVERSVVPRSGRTFDVIAWLDDEHVAVVRRVGNDDRSSALVALDVRTGVSNQLIRYPLGTDGTETQLATDLLDRPTVARPKPPSPMDPQKVLAYAVLVVAAGLGLLIGWRRRVRA